MGIHPGHGKTYIRSDAKLFKFGTRKAFAHFIMRHNPRKMAWTQVYRRMNKKGTLSSVRAKKARKVVKKQRGFVGLSLEQIREKQHAVAKAKKSGTKKENAKARDEKRAAKKAAKKAQKLNNRGGKVRRN